MRTVIPLLMVMVMFLLNGCAISVSITNGPESSGEDAQVKHRLEQIFDAVQKKDLTRLDSYHLYGTHFTKFAPESSTRMNAEAARKGEHDGISALEGLSMVAEDLKVDRFGNVAIATFMLKADFTVKGSRVSKRSFTTLVFVKDHGEWKITHEHISVPTPSP